VVEGRDAEDVHSCLRVPRGASRRLEALLFEIEPHVVHARHVSLDRLFVGAGDLDRQLVLADRRKGSLSLHAGGFKVAASIHVVGLDFQGLLVMGDGLIDLPAANQRIA
jgi:hypothetical protein